MNLRGDYFELTDEFGHKFFVQGSAIDLIEFCDRDHSPEKRRSKSLITMRSNAQRKVREKPSEIFALMFPYDLDPPEVPF